MRFRAERLVLLVYRLVPVLPHYKVKQGCERLRSFSFDSRTRVVIAEIKPLSPPHTQSVAYWGLKRSAAIS
jgi:hypothetical protein